MTAERMIPADDLGLLDFTDAVQRGDLAAVTVLLDGNPEWATARFGDRKMSRCALHVATDFPGHFPNVAAVVRLLVERGADVDARFAGPHCETALHWAASSDDVEALDALVAAGADILANGGVLTDGPPLDDAVVFGQWDAARRLVELGTPTKLFHASALGMDRRVAELLDGDPPRDEITNGLWHACNAGHDTTAALLLRAGGDPNWLGYNDLTPVAAAKLSGNAALVALFD